MGLFSKYKKIVNDFKDVPNAVKTVAASAAAGNSLASVSLEVLPNNKLSKVVQMVTSGVIDAIHMYYDQGSPEAESQHHNVSETENNESEEELYDDQGRRLFTSKDLK
jgi:hypothetical protein